MIESKTRVYYALRDALADPSVRYVDNAGGTRSGKTFSTLQVLREIFFPNYNTLKTNRRLIHFNMELIQTISILVFSRTVVVSKGLGALTFVFDIRPKEHKFPCGVSF